MKTYSDHMIKAEKFTIFGKSQLTGRFRDQIRAY